jgi:hypothetical protein
MFRTEACTARFVTRHLEAFVLKLNCENPTLAILEPTFNAILDHFIEEERLLEIKQRPGDRCDAEGALSYFDSRLVPECHQAGPCEVGNHPHHADEAGEGTGMAEEYGFRARDQRSRQGHHAPFV